MSIGTKVTDEGKRLIIKLDEKFDFGKVQDFRLAYLDLSEDINHIEVDLSDTEYMDSSALGMLLNMQKSLNERQFSYSITHCRPQVARILKISRFDKKFEIS
ncbi:STAS domain-containing protein [Alteromonas antoniana]|uniref:STAS domain-containing protein n=1 Tax=Alteromonas antoniana TaxID=2803813 RepID=UPI001C43D9B3|nr:STAS domain-containing protein [Alteromonas antoniana]